MTPLRIGLLGSTGYIGSAFAPEIAARGHQPIPIRSSDGDIYDSETLRQRLDQAQADCLINCAGYTGKPNVDACETDKANCLHANAVLPGRVAKACRALNLPWAHVSSGCIYSGRRADGNGFTELDPPNFSFRSGNCSFYAGSKALGEEVIKGEPRCYVWRLRIPFSSVDSPRNYLSKLMRYDRLLDAENSLTHLPEFITAALACFEQRVPYGTYNLTNPGSVTTRQVVDTIRDSRVVDKGFQFFADEAEFMQTAAVTPRSNCVLDSSKALQAGLKLMPVTEAILTALANWQTTPRAARA